MSHRNRRGDPRAQINMKDIMVVFKTKIKIFKISEVSLRLARLVLGWATVSACHQPATKANSAWPSLPA